VEETAYAKINLALHVRGREADGFHRIETVFAFCEHGDRLSVAPGDGIGLSISGPFAGTLTAGEDNLVLRAARALAEHCQVETGAAISLEKNLPVAAGLGGGSADAGAVFRLLCRFWSVAPSEEELLALAAPLGADVPACLASRTARGDARGDRLTPWADLDLAGTSVLLVNPAVPLSTAAVFRAWDGIDRGPLTGLEGSRNDLEGPATELVPEVADALEALADAEIARMSGSGATCFGLYRDPAARDSAAARIRAAHPRWWTLPTRLR
jgi:4-diphosphocytidyl-2-C-methyl-D-erythritol kinase